VKILLSILLCTFGGLPATAQEGFSPTLPFGAKGNSFQPGDIRGGSFSPNQQFRNTNHSSDNSPHQDQRSNYARGYNSYYGHGPGYYGYRRNGYGRTYDPQTTPMPIKNGGPPGYDTPLPSNTPPGY